MKKEKLTALGLVELTVYILLSVKMTSEVGRTVVVFAYEAVVMS